MLQNQTKHVKERKEKHTQKIMNMVTRCHVILI